VIAVVAALFLISATQDRGPGNLASPEAACRLAKREKIGGGRTYSIKGTYIRGTHAAILELPKCDQTIWPSVDDNAVARLSEFHTAYRAKCGADLMGDYVRGVFTGHFVRRRVAVPLIGKWTTVNVFVITEIGSMDEDAVSITC
jgi:hypothetical protein